MPSRALARVGMLRSGEMQACLLDEGIVKAWHTVESIRSQALCRPAPYGLAAGPWGAADAGSILC